MAVPPRIVEAFYLFIIMLMCDETSNDERGDHQVESAVFTMTVCSKPLDPSRPRHLLHRLSN